MIKPEDMSPTMLADELELAHKHATVGTWGKGNTTHQTVATDAHHKTPYRIAEFHHANDAQFCDIAHAVTPAVVKALRELAKLRAL